MYLSSAFAYSFFFFFYPKWVYWYMDMVKCIHMWVCVYRTKHKENKPIQSQFGAVERCCLLSSKTSCNFSAKCIQKRKTMTDLLFILNKFSECVSPSVFFLFSSGELYVSVFICALSILWYNVYSNSLHQLHFILIYLSIHLCLWLYFDVLFQTTCLVCMWVLEMNFHAKPISNSLVACFRIGRLKIIERIIIIKTDIWPFFFYSH